MSGTLVGTRTWTFPRAVLTLLLSDFRLGEVPRPFEAAYPYTTVAGRAAFRERTRRELAAAGLLCGGELDPDLEGHLSALATAPVGIVVMGTTAGGTLLARGCWHRHGAVLARQDGDAVHVVELGTTPLVDALVALVPDADPAGGTSVTVPCGTRPASQDDRSTPFNGGRVGTSRMPAALAKVFTDPVVACGAFVPFAHRRFLPPVTWFDTAGRRGTVRRFTTTTTNRDGSAWTTYVPGGNARFARAVQEVVEPLVS